MTTKVTITHDGPDHNDILVVTEGLVDGKWSAAEYSAPIRLKNGDSTTQKYVHGSQRFVVSEIPSGN